MDTLIVSFDDIYYLQRMRASRTQPRHTIFTFGDRAQYIPAANIKVPGHPRIEQGMRVKVLMRKQGDWGSLIGWKDMETAQIASPDPRRPRWRVAWLAVWSLAYAYMVSRGTYTMGSASLLVSLPGLLGLLGLLLLALEIRDWRRAIADESAVQALTLEAPTLTAPC